MHGNILNLCSCAHTSKMHDIPASDSFICPLRKGFLQKLTGRGWLYSGSWKNRYCVLDGSKFYFYEKEHSGGGSDKKCGVINLDYYDLCEEAKDKKNPHVFAIGTSLKGLFDNRHQFSAETSDEMLSWIQSIQNAISEARANRTKQGRRRSEGKSPDLSTSSQVANGTNTACLVTATKDRPKGPQGRRLPQRKSMMPPPSSKTELNDSRQRSISLSTPQENWDLNEDAEEESPPRRQTSSESKWLSLSMEEMERDSDDAFESQRSSSAFDLPQQKESSPTTPQDETKPVHKRLGPRLNSLLGQHAALTKELEMKLKIGKPPPTSRRQHSESEDSDPVKREEASGRNIDHLTSKVKCARDSLDDLEKKVSLLSKKVESTHESNEKANSKVGDLLLQVTVTLQEAERINSECKRALEEVNRSRTEYQNLVKECKQTLATLHADPATRDET